MAHPRKNPSHRGAAASLRRRDFLGGLGAGGALLGLPSLLAGCGGSDDDGPTTAKPYRTEQRTLFFNLRHLDGVDAPHAVVLGGRHYRLVKVADKPEVLQAARQGNEFLRSVPDHHITHHCEAVQASADGVLLGYQITAADPASGTWHMGHLFTLLPQTAITHAHAQARLRSGSGPLRLSGKRAAYGIRAAQTEQDLHDEQVLIDATNHAATLIAYHPELTSLEPNSAAHIHLNHIQPDFNMAFVIDALSGPPAAPQGSLTLTGEGAWATLQLLTDDSVQPPVPLKMNDESGSPTLNIYTPVFSDDVTDTVVRACQSVLQNTRDDTTLGLDVTGTDPNQPPSADHALGKIWNRHDGVTHVARTLPAAAAATAASTLQYTFLYPGYYPGLRVFEPEPSDYKVMDDGRIELNFNPVFNWFNRFLGMFVQFLDVNGNVIPSNDIPTDTLSTYETGLRGFYSRANGLVFAGLVPTATTLFAVPVWPGSVAVKIRIPAAASKMHVFYGGPGAIGSPPDELDGVDVQLEGDVMTGVVNYGITLFFMGLGAAAAGPVIKGVLNVLGGTAIRELVVAATGLENGGTFNPAIGGFNALKSLLAGTLTPALAAVRTAIITGGVAVADIQASMPLVGLGMRIVAAVTGAAELIITSGEIIGSPPVYMFKIGLKHDLTVTVRPDVNKAEFPTVPAGYTIYHRVSYWFAGQLAAPILLDPVEFDPSATKLEITIPSIPRGGQVNVTIGMFVRRSDAPAGSNEWVAGSGTTGLVDNNFDTTPDITITENKVPIRADTVYIHTRRSALDANGRHRWSATEPRPLYLPPPGVDQPGLGDFRNITVRQGRSQPPQPGYLGYAWQAYSNGVLDCSANATGQLDQLAVLNTNTGNDGANAQQGYVISRCGQQAGVRLAYSLLSHDTQNCYLDSDTLHLRPIALDPPAIGDPATALSFGQLQMASDCLLMHPQGHVVSISGSNHRYESLRMATSPIADAQAAKRYRGNVNGGEGSRPGLMRLPVAATITTEGVVLVLEDSTTNNRIQALDLHGNPVSWFKQQPTPCFLQLTATPDAQYLDLAVEFSGFVYVLSKNDANLHRLDIYHPDQTGTMPICTTTGINAARLTVDLWRNVYTLNYEPLTQGGVLPSIVEPSVSLWVPPPPV